VAPLESKGFYLVVKELNKNISNIREKHFVMIYRVVVCGWNTKCKTGKKSFGGPYRYNRSGPGWIPICLMFRELN
jgi:hypothetical protein